MDYGAGLTFLRPLSDWLAQVDWQGKTLPRFAIVENDAITSI
jgi:hypothetical protein